LISAGALVVMAAVAVSADLDTLGLVVSIVVAWTAMAPLRALEEIVPDTEQALAAARRLFDLEDMQAQEFGDGVPAQVSRCVSFRGVSVRAEGDVLVDSIDLEVEAGSFLGIVGPSGSGKSTLVGTLIRHRDPSSGAVEIGGWDVSGLASTDLADAVAFVPQRPDVFHGSLRSNLLIAKSDAVDSEMRAALQRARLLEWVESLESGLDSQIGERGVGLSGGQLQRLALARALLRDPAVLVFDEATSELDTDTEAAVLGEVLQERGKRTLIVVAHRMETVTTADLIAVMDRGRLVEWGKHEELKAKAGLYAALWERHEDMLADI
jgi:ABC-type multidrug transport system fused ATPase/permease subunit